MRAPIRFTDLHRRSYEHFVPPGAIPSHAELAPLFPEGVHNLMRVNYRKLFLLTKDYVTACRSVTRPGLTRRGDAV